MNKKREVLLIVFLGILLYAFFFYKFVYSAAIPEIERVEKEIDVAQAKLDALERDRINIENMKRSLEMKNDQNDRLEEYLMNAANIADSIIYIDKLAKIFDNKIEKSGLTRPVQKVSDTTKTTYYEFSISMSAKMTYNEAKELVDYIEGGTRKVSIASFGLAPSKEKASGQNNTNQQNQQQVDANNIMHDLTMTVNIYSLSLGSIDRLHEYSSKKFNRFNEGDGVIFVPVSANYIPGGDNSLITTNDGNNIPQVANNNQNADLSVIVRTFRVAGQNFWVYGKNGMQPVKYKTKNPVNVNISFDANKYHLSAVSDGIKEERSGSITGENIDLYLAANFFTSLVEDQYLGANVTITNNSSKKVMVKMDDKPKRIKLYDRNGKAIYLSSDNEKVYIL